MTKIRVNPSSLINSASSVVSIASQVSKIGDGLLHATHGAPSYSGQFGPRVIAIALSSLAHAKKNQNFLTNQSSLLKKKASAFQSADSTSIANLRKTSLFPLIDSSTYLRLLSIIMGISIAQLMLLIKLGFLKIPFPSFPWSIVSSGKTYPNIDEKIGIQDDYNDSQNKVADSHNSITEPTKESINIQPYSGKKDCYAYTKFQRENNGLSMPTGMCGQAGKGLYDGSRHGESGTFSSGGKTYEFGQEPRVGAIMVESPAYSSHKGVTHGHVSFVKEVNKDSTGIVISFTISEENWSTKETDKTFYWNSDTNKFENSHNRVFDCFVY